MPSKSLEVMTKMRQLVDGAKLSDASDRTASSALAAAWEREHSKTGGGRWYAGRIGDNLVNAVLLSINNRQEFGGEQLKLALDEYATALAETQQINADGAAHVARKLAHDMNIAYRDRDEGRS